VLTKKGKYGLKAIVHLAGLELDALAQVADIAKTNSISKKFLDHILTELRHAGLVYSKKARADTLSPARPMRSGSARSCVLSTVLWPQSSALQSPHFDLATIAAISNPARSA
jgi:Iron-dependent Transcriptional regulator